MGANNVDLKSMTLGGRRLTQAQIASIQQTVLRFPALSRRELAHTLCEHLKWYTPKGKHQIQSCLSALERLQALGVLSLPAKVESKKRGAQKPLAWTPRTEEPAAIADELARLTPISLQVVAQPPDIAQWNEYVDRYHYLGYKRPIGPSLRYFIVDKQGRQLGCLMFSYATQSLACRDEWIGWHEQSHKKHLDLIVNNNRFLIFPWVHVKCLASKVLSMAAARLGDDWQAHHGYRPVLMETFVDPSRFKATCYRAANWQYLGQTKGRAARHKVAAKGPKDVYVYALTHNAKSLLINGPKPTRKTRNRPVLTPPKRLQADDPFVQLWQTIIGTVIDVAEDFDRQWQQRKRRLNTLLIMLFVFRLVLSDNRQGYTTTIAELWEQCRVMGVPLPQETPVAASAFCAARAKLDEDSFKQLHARLLAQAESHGDTDRWQGHRLFAIDGSKINLPRPLRQCGYKTPADNAHYPQGLLSCLYQLKSKLPMDFHLTAQADERALARRHLATLGENDVVVYDRGYFSYALLFEHRQRGIHPIFRLKSKANKVIEAFMASPHTEQVVHIAPNQGAQNAIAEQYPGHIAKPIALRLLKYTVGGTTYLLGTTLFDRQTYTIEALSDVYHSRWGIEELYKVSKQLMTLEDFHGRTERGVKQELYAHFILITLARLFSNHSESGFNSPDTAKKAPTVKVNFKHCLHTVARHIEGLLVQQATLISETINRIVACVSSCRQKLRPNRSYPRRSRKPIGKWKPAQPAKITRNKLSTTT